MELGVSAEQQAILATVDHIAARYDRAYWLRQAKIGRFPQELWQALGTSGLLGIAVPEAYGGVGLGLYEMALVQERLAEHGIPLLLTVVGPGLGLMILSRHADEGQKRQWLAPAAAGKTIFCFGMTEPGAGSNIGAIATWARQEGADYVITGEKHFISGADQADFMLLVARTGERRPGSREGLSLFVVDMKSPGIRLFPQDMLLTCAERQFQVAFDRVRVPGSHLVGEPGQGFSYLFDGLNPERINVAALAVGLGRRLLQKAVAYAADRRVFTYPVGAYQGVQHPLAEAKVHLELAALMNRYAAQTYDRREEAAMWANMAKLAAVDAALEVADTAIEVHGGNGFTADYDLISLWGMCRLFKTAPVSRELVLNYIGRHGLGLPQAH